MRILSRRVFRGPNIHATFPVLALTVDLGALEHYPSARIPDFADRLMALLPGLGQHSCSYGAAGGFERRLREQEGTWMGHVLEHVAIELQCLTGAQVTFGKTRGTGVVGHYRVIFEYEDERVAIAAANLARTMLLELIPAEILPREPQPDDAPGIGTDEPFEPHAAIEELIAYAHRYQLGPSTGALVRAAEERNIPWLRLNEGSLVQFGHGRHQKRIQATITSETRYIAVDMASDKELTNRILADLGLPVPRQETVTTERGAMAAAREVGFPVVVKPLDANHGRGVSVDLTNDEQVALAFAQAKVHCDTIIVESYVAGDDHRMLVVGGELVAVAKRVPGHVVGDGEHSVAELLEQLNLDPRRGVGHEKVLTRIEIDFQAERLLTSRGFTVDTVPPAGEVVRLRSTGNLSTGGTAIDVTDEVHHDNREMAVRAAQAIGLDVAGIDFISPDIRRSYRDVGGAICEVNAAPGFRMHQAPTEGTPRDVAAKVIDMLFPPGTPTRIPMAAVTGTNGKTTTARMLAHIHKLSGGRVGLSTTDGVYIDGERTVVGDMTGPVAAQMVLRDPTVDVAVLETARGGLLRAGLGYRQCNVAAVLNVSADHLGLGGVDTLEQLADVKRVIVEVARDCAVLNADDEYCLRMADHSPAARIAYVTANPHHGLVKQHIQAGGLAAVLEDGINGQMITLYDKGMHIPLLWTHLIPATVEGKARHNVLNAMFAAVMAYAMDVRVDNIRHGLRTFDTTYFQAPGRLNVFDQLPFKVIMDYGHNPAAVQAMGVLVEALEVRGSRICVLSAPGDRRDEDIIEIAKAAAPAFDRFILRSDDDPRGRTPEEVPMLLQRALLEAGVAPGKIEMVLAEQDATQAALDWAVEGDLVLIFADQIARTWKQVIYFQRRPGEVGVSGEFAAIDPIVQPMAFGTGQASPYVMTGDVDVVKDERGVRIRRELED